MNQPLEPAVPALRTTGTVRVIGSGLLGASIGLGLASRGGDVVLDDVSPAALSLAVDYGAGRAASAEDQPALVVVCVPPDVVASVVLRELAAHPEAIVTDVASVKTQPLRELREHDVDLSRYVGSHPMAGRERGGAVSARGDLFVGRPWVMCCDHDTAPEARARVEGLALDLGGTIVEMDPQEHDFAVGLVSHVPQVISSLLGQRLCDAPHAALRLAGQGLRDVVRLAASAPELWLQILAANREHVVAVLDAFRDDLAVVTDALRDLDTPGSRRILAEHLAAGNVGVARLPGKHGQDQHFATVVVLVDDVPGSLARLFVDIGEAGINLEDVRLEHAEGRRVGLAEISVLPEAVAPLTTELTARGWRIAG
ncbi:prephenate dehydrogenase [Rathayibacter toxicus]|uniref:prephenate dehydrogenase n=1 Tax=Rathayibacter toxicus TaxID=145458 RepID=UPI000CE8A47C|nr:prephenate dehydrogenase [Rathayibacter toxicus]PPI55007.1 prephenate dehydrogenase [Rathayibacter toxicus]QWL28405.1 prephenate dehydrogenase [Rathayibacter toxicus]QWL32595.1 prephenate dehydrogenase [Rathayibacter toxicus]QWL34690.1 prephenate dehydrogenase [Rathayibacter toxicus]QWL36821.1 prephenate dehydrogenase [Rathayibacter toxicus]